MRAVAVGVGVAVAALLLGSAVAVWLVTRDPTDHGLGDALAAAHDGDRIDLRDHVDSDWDRWYVRGPYQREDGQPVMTDDRALLVFVASDEVVDTKQVLRADADFSCLDRSAVGELRADEVEIAAFRPRLGAAPVRFAAFAGATPRQREDLRACFRRLWG